MSFFVEPRVYPRRQLRPPEAWRRFARDGAISLERALLIVGALLLGWCGWTLAEAHTWQRYAGWSLERQRRGETASVAQYLASRVGLGAKERPAPPSPAAPEAEPLPSRGDLLGRLDIPRLGLSAIVLEGDDAATLKLGVGHIPGTALPGPRGNMALAAHHDRAANLPIPGERRRDRSSGGRRGASRHAEAVPDARHVLPFLVGRQRPEALRGARVPDRIELTRFGLRA